MPSQSQNRAAEPKIIKSLHQLPQQKKKLMNLMDLMDLVSYNTYSSMLILMYCKSEISYHVTYKYSTNLIIDVTVSKSR